MTGKNDYDKKEISKPYVCLIKRFHSLYDEYRIEQKQPEEINFVDLIFNKINAMNFIEQRKKISAFIDEKLKRISLPMEKYEYSPGSFESKSSIGKRKLRGMFRETAVDILYSSAFLWSELLDETNDELLFSLSAEGLINKELSGNFSICISKINSSEQPNGIKTTKKDMEEFSEQEKATEFIRKSYIETYSRIFDEETELQEWYLFSRSPDIKSIRKFVIGLLKTTLLLLIVPVVNKGEETFAEFTIEWFFENNGTTYRMKIDSGSSF